MTPAGEGTNALSGGPATLIAAAATQFSRIFQIVDAVFFPHFFSLFTHVGQLQQQWQIVPPLSAV